MAQQNNPNFGPNQGAFWGLTPTWFQNASQQGPEDAGKTRARVMAEQFGAGIAGAPLTALDFIDQQVTQRGAEGVSAVTDYLGQPVDTQGQTEPFRGNPWTMLFGAGDANQQENPESPGSFQPMPQQQGGQQGTSVTLPPLGPQAQFPGAPQYAMPNFGAAAQTLAGAGPARPNFEAYQDVPQMAMPNEPRTAATEDFIQNLEGRAPEGPDEQMQNDRRLIGVLGAMAAGAGSTDGTSFAQTLAAAGARGAQAWIQEADKRAQEDKEFQNAQSRYQQTMLQARSQLEGIKNQYDEAVRQTQYGNAQAQYDGQMRAEQARQQYQQAAAQHQQRIAQMQMDAEQARVNAINRQADQEYQNQIARYKVDSKASGYEIRDGNLVATVRKPDGSMEIKTTPLGKGMDVSEQLGVAKDYNDAGLPSVGRNKARQAAMTEALQNNDPGMALQVAAQSLGDKAPMVFTDSYQDEVAAVNERLAQQGIMQGSKEYQEAFQRGMSQRVLEDLVQNPSAIKKLGDIDPFAKIVADKFYAD